MKLIDKAKHYTAVLSTQNLSLIETMYAPGVIYQSSGVGHYTGSVDVMEMLRAFFAKYPDFRADVSNFRGIGENCVAFDFTINLDGVDHHGVEHLYFDNDEKITLIEVAR